MSELLVAKNGFPAQVKLGFSLRLVELSLETYKHSDNPLYPHQI
jgi:hypothetical protein